jgi:hypothetical protein
MINKTHLIFSVIIILQGANLSAQQKIEGNLLITGGITEYNLTDGFEYYCSESTLKEEGRKINQDIIELTSEHLVKLSPEKISISKDDSSYAIEPCPFGKVTIRSMFPTSVPTEFYFFDANGNHLCDFDAYFYLKPPKFSEIPISDLGGLAGRDEYALVIWPLWWFHSRTETTSINSNDTYCSVAFGLYYSMTGDLLYSDWYYTSGKGREIKYQNMLENIAENISKKVLKYISKN